MRRRDVLVLLGAATAWRRPARAQQRPIPVVGFLSPRTLDPGFDAHAGAFRRSLRELGYVEGRTISVELRSSDGENKRLPALAAELAALKPDVIVTHGEPAIRAVKEAAGTIPIVMSVVGDPVASGFAQSLARPGGNLTGLTNLSIGLVGKRLEILLETVPNPGCVAVMRETGQQALDARAWREVAAAAETLRAVLKPIMVSDAGELDAGFAEIARQGCRGLLVMASAVFVGARQPLVTLAAQHRIPASYDNRLIVEAGGLMSYGPDTGDMHRRAAQYVDKILKGAKPADLPIEQPTKFELAVNLKTAKSLGLTIPPTILGRADEVIE
jgi:putative tryptophan/tyrosine transport system substrate-binding protein